ncbi:uncharacterized AAA domain-containing protein P22H7.05c [Cucumis sativus]|uniref:uncharacterized AAA domain-containing protein P22H7.05c n=1 Tax=Cucumis sativus TaxID=3659 RepID=UPI0012F49600|nr:uncharacterized AAA domain-containing protein P22H7.05c [Cucumis sativus]
MDGLAPCRTSQQDHTHNSVVSTLLALLDGLKSRSSVAVIGATNRPNAIDPALRRPGRFDREIYFPLPSLEDRISILSLYTQKWPKTLDSYQHLLHWIAKNTSGFAGADLQPLCTQTAINALKKATCDPHPTQLPVVVVEDKDWLEALSTCPPLCSRREALAASNETASSPLPFHLIPWNPRSGQRHLASCILNCFVDHVVIRKVDMATISQGYATLGQGIAYTFGYI